MRIPLPRFFPTLPALEDPIRAEIFGIERLEQHAQSLAEAQKVMSGKGARRPLLPRVTENGRVLRAVNRTIGDAVRAERWITPAAEWLLDNFFVVDEQLREIRADLPEAFYRELPALADGPLAGFPRVYGIAWAYVAHTDSRFDLDSLKRFVQAYQRVQPLTIGELWAVTISLRVVLVENLRRMADAIARGRDAREAADALADELLELSERGGRSMTDVMFRDDNPRLVTAFAVELLQRLRDRDPAVTPALVWLHERLAAQGTTADEIALVEHRRQAALTVTVRNIIVSMRLMSAIDWTTFFESVSLVDAALREGSDFAAMDFASRDSYRHGIEALARGSARTELEITRQALEHARAAKAAGVPAGEERRGDPGYYLLGGGRRAFERSLGFRPTLRLRLARAFIAAATPGYLGTLALLTAAIAAVPLALQREAGLSTLGLIVLALCALVPASDLALALLNRFVTAVVSPRLLPRLKWPGGVPASCRTMVAVPTILGTLADVDEQIERLEVHFLANPDGDLRFALLSDFRDAATEHAAGDDEILAAARAGIADLNARHGPAPDGGPRFFVLHRRRLHNPCEDAWIGWERKRGKLHELNRLLRGFQDTSFLPYDGHLPPDVRFVLTLDADTRLPIGAVARLAGTLAHPLNRPRLDPATRRVVEGYAVLQPRVTAPLPGQGGSRFQRMTSGAAGIDPYAGAVSDVYQDLFGEGSYTGKGIYDIDAFEAALAGRVPDNTLLSHDLFEGLFARAGLVTDVELFERAPGNYLSAASRQYRWARGDWQLLPWILRERFPAIQRWKMVDNLRRTLSMPMLFLTLVAAWVWPGASPMIWTAFVCAVIAVPALIPAFAGIWPRVAGISKRSHLRAIARDFGQAVQQMLLVLVTVANQAWRMSHAIARTLWRLTVSHRRLLEWRTSQQTAKRASLAWESFYQRMAGGVAISIAAAALVLWRRPSSAPLAAPFLLLWMGAPLIMLWLSRPAPVAENEPLSAEDRLALRLIARRTWDFFARFVTEESRWLPPDNFQETPQPVVAQRTSPTNIALYLLSVVSARDFGWIGTLDATDRLEATLATVKALERHRGHLFNWYRTSDGAPLDPRYVSSVDSGNLAAALIALANACRDMMQQGIRGSAMRAGILDSALLLRDAVARATRGSEQATVAADRLDEALEVVLTVASQRIVSPTARAARLAELDAAARTVANCARDLGDRDAGRPPTAVLAGAVSLLEAVETHFRDLKELLPWSRERIDADTTALMARFTPEPSLLEMPDRCTAALHEIAALRAALAAGGDSSAARRRHLDALAESLERSAAAATALGARLAAIAADARAMVNAMDFRFLYDPTRQLFAIGYRLTDGALDTGRYDLLASEARMLSFLAIAKGDAPVQHWFRLGRLLTPVRKDSALMSWSGSMFEYLMPSLLMRAPMGSLLEQTCRLVVQRQIDYGAERGVPWGISESGYFARDLELTFQYSSFGVPGLGLKRGLGEDVVVAPYATALAAMFAPQDALENFEALARAGADGRYGYYESLDYTAARLPADTLREVVRMYMAHHQGMAIVAIGNVLHGGVMRDRFHAEPMVRASELLLQERTPRHVPVVRPTADAGGAVGDVRELVPPQARNFASPGGAAPQTQLLSNGRYAVMITAAGSGYSRWRDLAVTRWREDVTSDDTGSYIFLRDVASGERWSAGFQPSGAVPSSYEVSFTEDRAEFTRRDGAITTRLEVIVSSEDDAEVRRVSITNHGLRTREIEVTSYAEIVLATPASDTAHPAFSNLFVQTESILASSTLLATRRRRSPEEPEIWLAHVLAVEGETVGDLECETDRAQFLGRGRRTRAPEAEVMGRKLSNTVGSVLDPIVSLRRRVRVRPGKTVRATFSTLVASTRSQAIDLADKYHDVTAFERAATEAWTQAQVQMHHLGIESSEAHLFQSIGGSLLYADRRLSASAEVLARRVEGKTSLWAHGISGDLPIVLVKIDEADDVGIVRQLLRAHAYWRLKGLLVDLVILNDRAPSYIDDLQVLLETLVRTSDPSSRPDAPAALGRVFTLRSDRMSAAQQDVLESVARVELSSRRGTLAEQVARAQRDEVAPLGAARPLSSEEEGAPSDEAAPAPAADDALEFSNGLGGFDAQGTEYVITLRDGQWTPAPWINVLANPEFGGLVSESGAGCTWSVNSQENLLTAWSNDPVCDPPSDMLYLQDQDSGDLWTATPQPIRVPHATYVVRHGHGYTRFTCDAHGVHTELLQFVPANDPVKIGRLTITNRSTVTRHLSVTSYHEWVLGVSRVASAPFVSTEIDAATGAMFARNTWNRDFGARVAFADLGGAQEAWTGDRREFLGRNGAADRPAALGRREPLSGRTGAIFDPCCALQTSLEIEAGAQATLVFLLGQTDDAEKARALITRYRSADVEEELKAVVDGWSQVLRCVQVKTPDRAFDLMLNQWLLYQTLASRVWARTAFYQASGAYGFRDQLQDVMALAVTRPDLTRAQLLRAGARQFREGDVQHWWHEPSGRGVRTRIVDDLLWLPYAATHYVRVTGDTAVLDERIPFLEGAALAPGQTEAYFDPRIAGEDGTLYEHCARAIDRSLAVGSHELPLIGTGDWNDGMNRVGAGGKGESVWLAWFLHAVLSAWAPVAVARGESTRSAAWAAHAKRLAAAVEREGWDGEWYRRAFFDDGTPLGTAGADACVIDSIAQSWAVMSGVAAPERARRAMASVDQRLVRRSDGLVLLLTPPFDHTALEPGYIKGYVPGVRENGGQYTHAAAWTIIAFAALGDGDRAAELFSMVNPINRSAKRPDMERYRVEPYVVPGDVYSESPHAGRGGWTWYTGSAGWLYRAGIEWLLGIRIEGTRLAVDPCIPAAWPGFTVTLRHRTAQYEIAVENPSHVCRGIAMLELDGEAQQDRTAITLADDGASHRVRVVLGARAGRVQTAAVPELLRQT